MSKICSQSFFFRFLFEKRSCVFLWAVPSRELTQAPQSPNPTLLACRGSCKSTTLPTPCLSSVGLNSVAWLLLTSRAVANCSHCCCLFAGRRSLRHGSARVEVTRDKFHSFERLSARFDFWNRAGFRKTFRGNIFRRKFLALSGAQRIHTSWKMVAWWKASRIVQYQQQQQASSSKWGASMWQISAHKR